MSDGRMTLGGSPHLWVGDTCIACKIRRDWAGARFGCKNFQKLRDLRPSERDKANARKRTARHRAERDGAT
jgi:hypothetical protein